MKLIVGLGNPGEKYRYTRHNIGAKVVNELARRNEISLRRIRYFSHFGEGKIGDESIAIILPMTYMNLSGEAVLSAIRDKEIAPSELLVVCDDADLELGTIRIRPFGSDGGHRGLRSIIEKLGSGSFARLRIGIGKRGSLKDHVLRSFNKSEIEKAEEVEERAAEAALSWLRDGIEKAMSKYNAKSQI